MGSPQPTPPASGRRKRLGAWYTPAPLVEHLVDAVLDESLFVRPLAAAGARVRVLDPACGDGRFLTAAARRLQAAGTPAPEVCGVDIDPEAVALARAALRTATAATVATAVLTADDALGRRWDESEPFDVVIGNPPFLNQLATATSRGGRSRWGGGPYADAAAEFLALAVQAARPDGGRIAFVLPQSILTSRDAGAVRELVAAHGAIRYAWWSRHSVFDAQVRTIALVVELGAEQGRVQRTEGLGFEVRPAVRPEPSWGVLVLDEPDDTGTGSDTETGTGAGPGGAVLGDLAEFTVDFRDQYYGLVGAVGDDVDGPPLVTSGLIEPGRCLWGERPVRFAKRRFVAPRVDLDALSPAMRRWAAARLVPKVLVANQTRGVEAVLDLDGRWLPGVPVITAVPRPGSASDPVTVLEQVVTVLSSEATARWVRRRAAGSGLSADSLRLSPRLLAAVPVPVSAARVRPTTRHPER